MAIKMLSSLAAIGIRAPGGGRGPVPDSSQDKMMAPLEHEVRLAYPFYKSICNTASFWHCNETSWSTAMEPTLEHEVRIVAPSMLQRDAPVHPPDIAKTHHAKAGKFGGRPLSSNLAQTT